MSLSPTINLPWFITAHALGLLLIGSSTLLQRRRPHNNSNNNALLGIATIALGLSYLATAYVPLELNAFLYASVPVRMLLALLAAARVGAGADSGEKGALLVVAAYDGLGGGFYFPSFFSAQLFFFFCLSVLWGVGGHVC